MDIVSYLLQANGFSAGSQELGFEREVLDQPRLKR
jgi:hypothetical protein